ncbi:hypothetical protein [Bartonella sp. B39]
MCGELVRASGTKPAIRIMVEGDKREILDAVVTEMMDVLTHHDAFSKVGDSWQCAVERYKRCGRIALRYLRIYDRLNLTDIFTMILSRTQ